MDKWVLLEHEVYNAKSKDIHYDFLVENGIDCLTWKFLKLPLLNQASIEISKQPNHRLVWLSRVEHELSDNRGFVKRIDHGIFKNVLQTWTLKIIDSFWMVNFFMACLKFRVIFAD